MNSLSKSFSIQAFCSSEAGAWSNAYLISGGSEAVLFDVSMLRTDAVRIADAITKSGKILKAVIVSHAHPDHFMASDVIADRFPEAKFVSSSNVTKDLATDGPWIFSMLQGKLGPEGPKRLVVPVALTTPAVTIEGFEMDVVEFGEGECKHIAAVFIPKLKALFSADLVYNQAHLYLQEKHLDSWLALLDELEAFCKNRVTTFYPGHGESGGFELIGQTRAYLYDFKDALKTGDAKSAEKYILDRYPDYHVKQFLTAFSIPAYFPPPKS